MVVVKGRSVENRKGIIGGSQIASLLGVEGAFGTEYSVWQTFMGHDTERKETEAMMMGHVMEPVIAKMYSKVKGVKLRSLAKDRAWRHSTYEWAICHPDRIINSKEALEIKLVSSARSGDWYDEMGEDQIPMYYLTQVMWYFIVNEKLERVHVARYTDGKLYCYTVERSEHTDLITGIENAVALKVKAFLEGYVPERNSIEETYSYRSIAGFGKPADVGELTLEMKVLAKQYREAADAEKEAKEKKQEASRKMAELVGETEFIRRGGRKVVYWVSSRKGSIDSDKLKEKFPEAYMECYRETSSTYIRISPKDDDIALTAEEEVRLQKMKQDAEKEKSATTEDR